MLYLRSGDVEVPMVRKFAGSWQAPVSEAWLSDPRSYPHSNE